MPESAVIVRDLRYRYADGTQAIRDVSFQIAPGEILGLLGPSGAGKTTTVRILTGLLSGWGGAVTVLGRPLEAWGADLYEHIGVAFEQPTHYRKLTARENLEFFAGLYAPPHADADALLDRVGLGDAADTRVAAFSKGMATRLGVARALLHQPEVLFLDEPTTGLDPVNAQRVRSLIKEQGTAGRTILLTTHDMHLAEALCDRIAFVGEGRVLALDAPTGLKLARHRRSVRVTVGQPGALETHEFPLLNLSANKDFLALLARDDLQTIHTQEATLDDVFIAVTGESAQGPSS